MSEANVDVPRRPRGANTRRGARTDSAASPGTHPDGSASPLFAPFRLQVALPAAADADAYDLHLTAVEYGLAASIAIRGPEDIRSREHWAGRFDPYEHQVRNLLAFCRRAPVALIADEVGLGKTISAGLIISELRARQKVSRVLVVAPAVLLPQWQEEMGSKFGIAAEHATGKGLRRLVRGSAPIVITTYQSLRNHYDAVASGRFDMVVLDEAHKLRNLFGTARPPELAEVLRQGLARRDFKFVLMLTATPIQNRLWDLYSLVDCLAAARGHKHPLGRPAAFARDYLADGKTARALVPERADEFRHVLADYMLRRRRADCGLLFPERTVQTRGDHPSPQDLALLRHLAPVLREVKPLLRISLAQAVMSSPEALAAQLASMREQGTLSPRRADELIGLSGCIENTGKLRRLLELVEALQAERPKDWRVVVFTTRTCTLEALGRALSARGVAVAAVRGGAPAENRAAIADFWADPPRAHVLVSTDAGAEGVNLQVASVLVNYDLPWNPMVLEQRIGRIQRLASRYQRVVIVNLVVRGTVEEQVVGRLLEKLQTVSSSLGDVEGVLEALSERDEAGLERDIRELVVQSLQGIDVEQSVVALQQSIEAARALYDEEKEEVERHLGTLVELERAGPRPPELPTTTPRRTVKDFAVAALTVDGGVLEPSPAGGLLLQRPDEPNARVWFDDPWALPFESGVEPTLVFREGRPDFERLVEQWCGRDAHHVRDLRGAPPATLRQLAAAWVATELPGCELLAVEPGDATEAFQGSLALRAGAAVAHDRYEKLLEVVVRPAGHDTLAPEVLARSTSADDWLEGAPRDLLAIPGDVPVPATRRGPRPLVARKLKPGELVPGLEPDLRAALAQDPDLAAFCGFYRERLEEELARTGGQKRLATHVRRQLEPRVSGEVVGLEGALYSVIPVQLRLRGRSGDRLSTRLVIAPALGQVVEAPVVATCAISGVTLPDDQLETCVVTGVRAARQLMARSAHSGAWALREHLVHHKASGELLLPSEARGVRLQTCAVTGRQAVRTKMAKSALSGAWMIREVAVQSPATGRWCEPDRARRCAWTGQQFPSDELGTCRVTGLPVVTSCLSPEGMLVALQELAQRSDPASADTELLTWLQAHAVTLGAPVLRKARVAWSSPAESGHATAVVVEVPRVLGLGLRRLGFVLAERPARAVVGRVGVV